MRIEAIVDKVMAQAEGELIKEKQAEAEPVKEDIIAEKIEPALVLDSQGIYTGEVDLVVASSVDLKLVTRLYNYLQTVPELKILATRGSWDQGTTITVVPDKPMPLIEVLSRTPDMSVVAESLASEAGTSRPSLLPRSSKADAKRIRLILKEN